MEVFNIFHLFNRKPQGINRKIFEIQRRKTGFSTLYVEKFSQPNETIGSNGKTLSTTIYFTYKVARRPLQLPVGSGVDE